MNFRILLAALSLLASVTTAHGALINWTDWELRDGMISGSIGGITVKYTGMYSFVQTGGATETNYWTENGTPAPYTGNDVIDNAPTAAEMIALNVASTHTITFSEAILNPVMTIVSMGQPSLAVSYDFDTDFTVLSNGVGYWSYANGGLPGTYTVDDTNDILTGNELHAAIQFNGLVSQITWTSSPNEYWHGFTFGQVTGSTSVPEPTSLALLGLGLAGIGFARRRKA